MKPFPILLIGIFLGASIMYVVGRGGVTETVPVCPKRDYINAFACIQQVIQKGEYTTLKADIESYITEKQASGVIERAGVYFRDLRNGPTMGVHEYEEYSTASLLKVPILIAYLSLAEERPEILGEVIAVRHNDTSNGSTTPRQQYPPDDALQSETPYTIEALMERVAKYSDNMAAEMLRAYLPVIAGGDPIHEVEVMLGLVPDDETGIGDPTISIKRYSAVFRVLYNASYLSADMSERALALLAESTFDKGIVGGVPEHITVSHKFGERSYVDAIGNTMSLVQLHDCGIVYYPDNPYLICVMTRGARFEDLEKVIGDISRMVYTEVDSRRIIPH